MSLKKETSSEFQVVFKVERMSKPILYGFDGSAYVRSVKMLLAEKQADFNQISVDLMSGEHRQSEHLNRNPFGKVPVLDHGSLRLYETNAIQRYLNAVLTGSSFVPDTARDEARMCMAIGIIDSFGYAAMVLGVTAFHLFPDFVGGVSDEQRQDAIERSELVLAELEKIKGDSPYIAGDQVSLADFHVAPVIAYVSLTSDAPIALSRPSIGAWWDTMKQFKSFEKAFP